MTTPVKQGLEPLFEPLSIGDTETAAAWIADGRADAVTFGRPFIANPDLPERFRQGAALNDGDRATYYGGDQRGYTVYPSLRDLAQAA